MWGCAKVSVPSGGPRDITPPVAISSIPENFSRNFKEKKLVITFNENVILENINEKFMVSPPMETMPEIIVRGKNVIVTFEDDLRDSTTYTFNFQDAIRDLNESNPLNNYQFVFSTGRVIDSLSVSGHVFNAFNLNVPENTLVMLYSNLQDSAVQKLLPDYISRVNLNGSFSINNIQEGKYRLYALKDVDNSKNYNQVEEEFAFLDSLIEVNAERNYTPPVKDTISVKPPQPRTQTGKPIEKPGAKPVPVLTSDSLMILRGYILNLFAGQKTAHYLTSSNRNLPYKLTYTLALPPDTLNFELEIPDAPKESYFIEKSIKKDTVNVWITDSSLFSKQEITTLVSYPLTDSTGAVTINQDTIEMRFLTPRQTRGKVKQESLQVKPNFAGGVIIPDKQIAFTTTTPFRIPDTSRISLFESISRDSTGAKVSYIFSKDTLTSSKYLMNARLEQGKKYLFVADSAAFGNIYGVVSDSIGIYFALAEAQSFGRLSLNIIVDETPLIIQLLDQSEKLIREDYINRSGKVEFPFLEKGIYRLRAIFDKNRDGEWTTGNFMTGRQPEAVSYNPNEIEVKIDWEVENDWAPEIKKFKEQKFREAKK
jgi:hypothetical protein